MKRGLLYLVAGTAAFLLFLAVSLPAAVVYGWLAPPQLRAAGLEGTIWKGEARSVVTEGLALGKSSWRFSPTGLLRGELAYVVETRIGSSSLRGIAGISPGGTVGLRDFTGGLPLSSLAALFPTGFFNGVAEIEIVEAELRQGWPIAMHGRIWVQDLQLLIAQPPLHLGSFQVMFDDQQKAPLTGRVSDLGGPLELSGSLMLEENRCYRGAWSLRPRGSASRELRRIVDQMGSEIPVSACL